MHSHQCILDRIFLFPKLPGAIFVSVTVSFSFPIKNIKMKKAFRRDRFHPYQQQQPGSLRTPRKQAIVSGMSSTLET
jgi:hypothetical protein